MAAQDPKEYAESIATHGWVVMLITVPRTCPFIGARSRLKGPRMRHHRQPDPTDSTLVDTALVSEPRHLATRPGFKRDYRR